MINRDVIFDAVCRAIEIVNEQIPVIRRITGSADTELTGAGHGLNSLEIVNLIVAVEDQVFQSLGVSISLADTFGGEGSAGAFETVETLVTHIASLIESGT